MKYITDILKAKHTLGIALGLMAAFVILFSQSFYFDYVSNVEGDVKTENSAESHSDSETVIKMAHQALSTVAEFAVQTVWHFITEIFVADKVETPHYFESYSGFTPYFQALFKLIISPNAP